MGPRLQGAPPESRAALVDNEDRLCSTFDEDFRRRVRVAMEQRGLTLRQLARHLGYSHTWLSLALAGKAKHPVEIVRSLRVWLRKVEARPYEADARALAAYRAEHGLSPTQLGARLDVSAGTIYKLESGRHAPRRAVRERIKAELGLALFGEPTA